MGGPIEVRKTKRKGKTTNARVKDSADALRQRDLRAELIGRFRAKLGAGSAVVSTPPVAEDDQGPVLPPPGGWTVTVGEDLETVHQVRNGRPACGASGETTEWHRPVNCPRCLRTSCLKSSRRDRVQSRL
ncbi:hypothetical protein RKE29_14230 [Streptomyces sp. B1866]|uniref:hypothetical protein n=1 Tax=Streptomyces sp. B1866 TaxID=3075431 RepID=UPI00288EB36C|nr:hypothetical protein [Streptomyces sp. B1866]MDT3397786.1 hypothetical protein [Streptomyces sp. B1866]